MEKENNIVALFDLDGVIIDSETQYFNFWDNIGKRYFPEMPDFATKIKGQTLTQIYEQYFSDNAALQSQLTRELNEFEDTMVYNYIPGAQAFLEDLHRRGVKMGIVTSSNEQKMKRVYAVHPELWTMVDNIFTAEMFPHSKPAPDCYLIGAEYFGVDASCCAVFEDSFNGLKSGVSAGMIVIGLSTSNPADKIAGKCNAVIPDFTDFSYDEMLSIMDTSQPLGTHAHTVPAGSK